MRRSVPLEAAAEAVCEHSSVPPLIFQLPPEQGRKFWRKRRMRLYINIQRKYLPPK